MCSMFQAPSKLLARCFQFVLVKVGPTQRHGRWFVGFDAWGRSSGQWQQRKRVAVKPAGGSASSTQGLSTLEARHKLTKHTHTPLCSLLSKRFPWEMVLRWWFASEAGWTCFVQLVCRGADTCPQAMPPGGFCLSVAGAAEHLRTALWFWDLEHWLLLWKRYEGLAGNHRSEQSLWSMNQSIWRWCLDKGLLQLGQGHGHCLFLY